MTCKKCSGAGVCNDYLRLLENGASEEELLNHLGISKPEHIKLKAEVREYLSPKLKLEGNLERGVN